MNATLRWVGGSAVVAALGFAALRPDDGSGPIRRRDPQDDALRHRADSLRSSLRVTREVIERGRVRALAREVTRTTPASAHASAPGEPRFVFGAKVGAERSAAIARAVHAELNGTGVARTAYPLAIVAEVDTAAKGAFYRVGTALPERLGDPCVVILSLPAAPHITFNQVASRRLLGPCAFFAAHGAPSEGTARWLRENRGGPAAFYVMPSAWSGDTTRFRAKISSLGVGRSAELVIRCIAGDLDACESYLGPLERGRWWFEELESGVDYTPLETAFPGTDLVPAPFWATATQRIRHGLLSELRSTLGDERFTAVWRDDRGIFDAYQEATGQRLGSFVRDQLLARSEPTVRGPGVPPLSAVFALTLAGIALAAAVRFAGRRMDQ